MGPWSYGSMMGYSGGFFWLGIFWTILPLVLLLDLILLGIWLWKQIGKK
ncbi:MAG: hypothetical protein V1697_00095 [Candidatus Levyibacteriota bacterium]